MPTTASTRIFASVAASSDPLPPSLPHLRHHLALRKCLPPEACAASRGSQRPEPRRAIPGRPSQAGHAAEARRGCAPGDSIGRFRRQPSQRHLQSAVFIPAGILLPQGACFQTERHSSRESLRARPERERERVRKRDRKKRRNNQSCTRAAHNACKSSSLAQVHRREFSHLVL